LKMQPDELVHSLNAHFTGMVDAIVTRRGIVDKYIGDCIMAFFGAPTSSTDDAWQAVQAAFDMLDSLERFNVRQRAGKKLTFRIGIGISYGAVTLGNIGSDKKMDYTVIGEEVNLASRMESLTKRYFEPFVFTDIVRKQIGDRAPCRPLGVVKAKGITLPVHVWSARRTLTEVERKAWGLHEKGLDLFQAREFGRAAAFFTETQNLLPGDGPSRQFIGACRELLANPPGPDWTGELP
jgi:adenylate cyclase